MRRRRRPALWPTSPACTRARSLPGSCTRERPPDQPGKPGGLSQWFWRYSAGTRDGLGGWDAVAWVTERAGCRVKLAGYVRSSWSRRADLGGLPHRGRISAGPLVHPRVPRRQWSDRNAAELPVVDLGSGRAAPRSCRLGAGPLAGAVPERPARRRVLPAAGRAEVDGRDRSWPKAPRARRASVACSSSGSSATGSQCQSATATSR
jgi:hypothetical protein